MSAGAAPLLKVGLLVDDLSLPAWVAKIVAAIQASDCARVTLVVRNSPPPPAASTWSGRWRERWQRGLYNRYRAWDRQREDGEPDAFAAVDLRPWLEGVTVLQVAPRRTRFSDYIEGEDLAGIRAARLDVLFRFGFRILRGDILQAARCGVWSYHHGDNREYRGSAAGFWEMYERNPVTGSLLQVLTEKLDAGQVLYRSWSATHPDSQHASINPVYWKSAEFALRQLRALHQLGWEHLQSQPDYREATPYSKPLYHAPATPVMARFLARRLRRAVASRAQEWLAPRQRHWFLALRRRRERPAWEDQQAFVPLASPPGRFWADPALFEEGGKTWLFFEDYSYASGRARISCAPLADGVLVATVQTALECDYHLSYPFLFRDGQDIYMIPETRAARRIELYRALEFPGRWSLDRVLMDDVEAVDATVHFHEGRWWLFCNIAPGGGSSHDELHAFWSANLQGPWHSHARNPVVSDVRHARPAGSLFEQDGRLVRPSQDCSVRYGSAIQFNQVLRLTPTEYEEQPCGRLEATWARGLRGTHTYNRSRDYEVVDGLRQQPRSRRRQAQAAAGTVPALAPTPEEGP